MIILGNNIFGALEDVENYSAVPGNLWTKPGNLLLGYFDFLDGEEAPSSGSFDRNVEQELEFTENLKKEYDKSLNQNLVFLQDIIAETSSRTIEQELEFTENLKREYGKPLNQTLNFSESVTGVTLNIYLEQELEFTENLKREYDKALNQTLALNDLIDEEYVRNINNGLEFDEIIEILKISNQTVNDFLDFNEVVDRNLNYFRELEDTLIFNPDRLINTGINDTIILVPNILYSRVRGCLVILSCPSRSIVLPCPVFGDTENLTDNLILHRSMNNQVYTYVRSNRLEELNYTFELGRIKALELKKFIEDFNTNVIKMENHKGELWYVQVNGPVNLVTLSRYAKSREQVRVSLELLGIKIL